MDIDLVYMWVDGNDPDWRKKKAFYAGEDLAHSEELSGKCRYVQNDELKYSLRSVEKYAPWIHRIFIVTDGQTPEWLDTSNPRVRIVDHSEIIDARYLPLFNSTAIELNLNRIPGLSEHFLLSNDDCYIGRAVDPSFFFKADGTPIVRLKHKDIVRGFSRYQDKLMNMVDETVRRYGSCCMKAPHHNIDAYRKSDWTECLSEYPEWYERTMSHRFRTDGDMHRHLITLWMLQRGRGEIKIVDKWNRIESRWGRIKAFITQRYATDSRYFSVRTPSFPLYMKHYNPTLFTINDDERATDRHRRKMVRFLEKCFPAPCEFEKK